MEDIKIVKRERKPKMEVVPVAPTPDNLISMAISSGRPMDEVQKLIDMRNAELARQAKIAFYQAMEQFQANCPDMRKVKSVNMGMGKPNYKYIELADIQKAVRKPLSDAGLSVSWDTVEEGDVITVSCTCTHIAGHSVSTSLKGGLDNTGAKNLIQQKASTITYLRRYTLTGVLGVSSGDIDDDGRGGPDASKGSGLRAPTDAQFKDIMFKLSKKQITVEEAEKLYSFDAGQMHSMSIAAK